MTTGRHTSVPAPREPDEDTDPDGPSQARRRADDPPGESGALSRRARPTWNVFLLIAAILGGAVTISGAFYVLATVAADRRVAPIEKKVDDHELKLAGKREIMDAYTRQQAEVIAEIRADAADTKKMIRALCRASARPQVCLGEN